MSLKINFWNIKITKNVINIKDINDVSKEVKPSEEQFSSDDSQN